MNSLRLAIVPLALATVGAVESAPESPTAPAPAAAEMADLPDFIDPLASDVRVGYGVQVGSSHRSEDSDSAASAHVLGRLVEQSIGVTYVRDLSGAQRALSGGFTWRLAAGIVASRASVENSHGSGAVKTVMVELGAGPAWAVMESSESRLEWELVPFVGVGRSTYDDDYLSSKAGISGPTSIAAAGASGEYGLMVNAVCYWSSGWGVAAQAGVVQRLSRLHGDSTTEWSNGTVAHDDFASKDTLTGARFGLSVAKRF